MSKCENYTYKHFNDAEIIEFFKNNYIDEFKNVIDKFHSIKHGAHKADLFRYYYLYINGGIFLDSDAMVEMNIHDLKTDESFFSILSPAHYIHGKVIFNGFIGAVPKNEIIYKALKNIYNISLDVLNNNYHIICKNLFLIIDEKKYNFKIKLFNEETWEQYLQANCNYTKVRDENNNIVLKHYCFDKKIPK